MAELGGVSRIQPPTGKITIPAMMAGFSTAFIIRPIPGHSYFGGRADEVFNFSRQLFKLAATKVPRVPGKKYTAECQALIKAGRAEEPSRMPSCVHPEHRKKL